MNELLDLEIKDRLKTERELRQTIHGGERALVWVGLILTVGVLVLTTQVLKQEDEIQQLREQVQNNRESVLHNAEMDQRQEVILSKLNQEYQMKHYKQEEKNE